jgi:hypothetical protein
MIRLTHKLSNIHLAVSRPVLAAILLSATVVSSAALAHHRPGHGGGGPGGGEDETWSFTAGSDGDVTGTYVSKEYTISNDVQNIVFNKPGGNAYWLSDYFRDLHYRDGGDGAECFVGTESNPMDPSPNFAGTMQLYDNFGNDSDLVARFWFRAGNDPVDPQDKIYDLQYVLSVYDDGQGWIGNFPPDQGVYSYRTATHWSLATAKKGARHNEPCVTDGIVSFSPDGSGVDFSVIQNP